MYLRASYLENEKSFLKNLKSTIHNLQSFSIRTKNKKNFKKVDFPFKIESAVATGATNPSKTSQLCTWNVPSGSKVNVKPKAIEELTFTKCTYTSGKENNAQDAKEKFMAYLPSLYESHSTELDDKSDIRADLYSILSYDIRTSCLAENIEGMRLSKLATTATAVPLSLAAMVENFSYNKIISVKQNINQLILELKLDKNDIYNFNKKCNNKSSTKSYLVWTTQGKNNCFYQATSLKLKLYLMLA